MPNLSYRSLNDDNDDGFNDEECHAAIFGVVNAHTNQASDSNLDGDGSFSFADTMKLRKNLASMFDQQVQSPGSMAEQPTKEASLEVNPRSNSTSIAPPSRASSISSIGSTNVSVPFSGIMEKPTVFSRIAQFEAAATAARPPLPVRQQSNIVPTNRVAVYLRIRPPTAQPTETNRSDGSATVCGTIQILKPKHPHIHPNTIRTHPPPDSNASKIHSHRSVTATGSATAATNQQRVESQVKEFQFHQVLPPDTTQKSVYSFVATSLLDNLFRDTLNKVANTSESISQHSSALLFSYGITNAGKTHTILGKLRSQRKSTDDWGIIPRTIADIFDRLAKRPKTTTTIYDLHIGYFEIYNEQIYDLLPKGYAANKVTSAAGPPLKVSERNGQTIVRGLTKHKVRSVDHGIELTIAANSRRRTSNNNINSGSSRSHCVCQMQLVPRASNLAMARAKASSKNPSSNDDVDDSSSVASMSGYSTDEEATVFFNRKTATLWVVDLAGSERAKRTGMVGAARQKEAAQINKSLMTLMRCLTVMRESNCGRENRSSNHGIIPFRESKLTHVFMGHLTGLSASNTAMIVNVNPAEADFDETQHVLGYASQAKLIQMDQIEQQAKPQQSSTSSLPEVEYDLDGRKKGHTKRKPNNDSKRSPIRKMLKHLSPKKIYGMLSSTQNKRNQVGKAEKRKAEPAKSTSEQVLPSSALMSSESKEPAAKRVKTSSNQPNSAVTTSLQRDVSVQQIETLRKELTAAQVQITKLVEAKKQLENDLEQQEAQIRMEVSEEMEERLRVARERSNQELTRLREQVTRMTQTSSQDNQFPLSTRKARMDQAERHIEELMDKVDECESEMIRMRQDHQEEIEKLKQDHATETEALNIELRKLKSQQSKSVSFLESDPSRNRIDELERQLEESRRQVAVLEESKKELVESYEQLLLKKEDNEREDDDSEESGGEGESKNDANGDEENEAPPLWKQKLTRQPTYGRKALGNASNKNEVEKGNSASKKHGPKWMFPKKPIACDENTGTYNRPTGRAPLGREWDAEVGAWKLTFD